GVVGQPPRAQAAKERSASPARRSARWTADQVLTSIAETGQDAAAVASVVCDWAKRHPHVHIAGGTGVSYPSITLPADSGRTRDRWRGVLSLYGAPEEESPMLEIRVKRMCRTPPYNRTEMRAVGHGPEEPGHPPLDSEDDLPGKRPNIPLGELSASRADRLLSIVDRWIEDIRAHTGEPEPTGES